MQKQLKNQLLKDLSPNKTKTVVISNRIKNFLDPAKRYTTLVVSKVLQNINFSY